MKVTAGEDMRSFKSVTSSQVKDRGGRVGGVGAMLREGDRGRWYVGDGGIHILTPSALRNECWSVGGSTP